MGCILMHQSVGVPGVSKGVLTIHLGLFHFQRLPGGDQKIIRNAGVGAIK